MQILLNSDHVMIRCFVIFEYFDRCSLTCVQMSYTSTPWRICFAMSKMHSRTSFTGPSFFLASTSKAGSTISMTSLNCVRSEVIEVERALREEFHLICPREHHHHFKGSVGLTTFGGKKLEPIPEPYFKFLLLFFLRSISSIFPVCNGTPHKHEHRWTLMGAILP